ncbi:UNVERIFIED_CONTAM: hypothetical protein FKN15_067643 [Acipenser sinensis]
MSLPNFPIPNLDTTLQEAGRVLGLILPPEEFQRYQSALRRQEAELQEIHARFTAWAAGRENWWTEEFKNCLLSIRDPIPTSTALPVLLQPSAVQGTPQLEGGPQLARAAALLRAAGKIHSDPQLLEGDAALEQTQRSELFSACREPGETRDQIKHFKHGRCNPTYSLSRGSLDLLGALLSKREGGEEEEEGEEEETLLLSLFPRALAEHKSLIKATKKGRGVGPHLAALRRSLGGASELKGFLDRFGRPSVYLTGQDLVGGVDSAVGNVYAQDQLAVTYLGKGDKVCLAMSGKGSFARKLGGIQGGFRGAMDVVAKLALKYALASMRGALEAPLGGAGV